MNIGEEVQKGVEKALAGLNFGANKPAPQAALSTEQHPVLLAALAAGIDTPEKFASLASAPKAEDHPVLKAAFAAGIDSPEKLAEKTAVSPVLTAALSAGVDSTEKFTQLSNEAKAGREALPGAREEAHSAAVAYFGTDVDGLKAAKDLIDGEYSFNRLSSTTEKYWAGAPGADRPEKRLSQPTAQTAANVTEKTKLAGQGTEETPKGDPYAQFNGKKAGS